MPYRNKVFVSFDGDRDIRYYRLMMAWKQSDHTSFDFYNAHEVSSARDSSLESTIKSSLQERMRHSKVFVLLIGESTRFLYKFVRWEIEQATKRNLPIICVNLNSARSIDTERCPPILRNELAMHVSFNAKIIEHALEQWPTQHVDVKRQGGSGPYFYNQSIYRGLGL